MEREKQPELNGKPLVFQTLDWYCSDIPNEDTGFLEYTIYVFGVSLENKPVTLKINDFNPFFFIEIPNGGRNLLDRFNFEHISLNSNSKNSDSNLDLAEHAFRMDFESLKTSQNIASVSPHRPLNSQSIANLEQLLDENWFS